MYWKPLAISMPSEGSVTGRPRPRNDSVASSAIELATCTVATTISGGRQFGRMCRNTTRASGQRRRQRRLDIVLGALGRGGAVGGAGEIGVLRRYQRGDQLPSCPGRAAPTSTNASRIAGNDSCRSMIRMMKRLDAPADDRPRCVPSVAPSAKRDRAGHRGRPGSRCAGRRGWPRRDRGPARRCRASGCSRRGRRSPAGGAHPQHELGEIVRVLRRDQRRRTASSTITSNHDERARPRRGSRGTRARCAPWERPRPSCACRTRRRGSSAA